MLLTKTKHVLLLLCISCMAILSVNAQQPELKVSGTVRNDRGEPVELASVKLAGTSRGTSTDSKGNFSIMAPAGGRLIISYTGYETLEVAAEAGMSVVLAAAGSLNDVVVIGYGTQRRKELTGSISTVTSRDFQQGSITTPEQLIVGKIAGVTITSNGGAPGAGSTIRIRGGASLNASNNPLIVVDGVPLSGNNIYGVTDPLSLINPNDIESFTVLKDASATAIYGSRASNGVIMVTTRKGGAGAPVIKLSSQVSVSTLVKKMDVQSADQFRKYIDSVGGGTFDNVHTYKSLLGNANTDWQDEIYRTAISNDNNLSITGSAKNIPYRLSVGYLNQDGLLETDNLKRISAGVSLTHRLLKDRLKIDINLKGAISKANFANQAAISSAVYFDPTQPVHTTSPYGGYYEWASVDPGSGAITLNKLAPRNPVALLDLYRNKSNVKRSIGNIQLDYSLPFITGLHAVLNLGYDVAKGEGTIDVPAYAAQNFLEKGQRNKYVNKIGNKVGEFYFNYIKDLKGLKSNINATAGYGYYDNLSTNNFYPNISANGDTLPGSQPLFPVDKPQTVLISYYGRLIYTWQDKYILAATVRTDGSSRFSPETRWSVFPSVALTWRANQESFLKDARGLSDLKFRLSYGVTGNQDGINNYPYQAVYSLSSNAAKVQFGDQFYSMGTPAAYDRLIQWEETRTYNAGFDYGFLNNRISGSVDVYTKQTRNLLNVIPIPSGANFNNRILTNIGDIENKGVEFMIGATAIKHNDFSWDINFNATYNTNKVTRLTATDDSTFEGTLTGLNNIQIHSVGYQANSFYVYHQQFLNGKPAEGVYADINNDGASNPKDLYRYKSSTPKWIFGFSTQFYLKKWTLSTVLRSNVGNYMYNAIATSAVQSNALNPLGYIANTSTDIYATGFVNGQPQSDYYIENASFLRMDNLGLGYNAGNIFGDRLKLRINANCQNVFTVTKYKGMDPEIFSGIDNSLYPRPRIFVLGLNLQF